MGAAAGPVAAVSSIASLGFGLAATSQKAGAAKAQAEGTNAADIAQAERLEQAQKYGETAAAQTAATDTENLNIKLDNIDAIRAASNGDPSSPTTAAIRSRTSYLAEREDHIKVGNIMAQISQEGSDAAYLRQAGQFALGMGDMSSRAIMLGGYADAAGKVGKTDFSTFGGGKTS